MGAIEDKFDAVMDAASKTPTQFDRAVLTPPEQIKQPEEMNTARIHTYIKPSEYKKLISLIGRDPVSSVVRGLILKFIREQDAKQNR